MHLVKNIIIDEHKLYNRVNVSDHDFFDDWNFIDDFLFADFNEIQHLQNDENLIYFSVPVFRVFKPNFIMPFFSQQIQTLILFPKLFDPMGKDHKTMKMEIMAITVEKMEISMELVIVEKSQSN